MVQLLEHATHATRVLKVLAHEQRLLILCQLTQGELPAGALVEASGQTQSSVSQHLGRLREGGLVKTRREGTTIYYSLADDSVRDLIDMLCERFGPAEASS